MSWLVPRSMGGLVVVGFVLASGPLILAVALSANALSQLSDRSEKLIHEAVTVARLGARLHDELVDLERSARQYVALGNPELLELFDSRWKRAEATFAELQARQSAGELAQNLAGIEESLAAVGPGWSGRLEQGQSLTPVIDAIRSAVEDIRDVNDIGARRVDAEVARLRATADAAHRTIIIAAGALLPATLALGFGLGWLVIRPLRQAERGIDAMGHAQYGEAIAIGFPREMQNLGEKLDWLRQRLAELEADQGKFLRHVTHELKTPLASMREGVDLLREEVLGEVTPRQREVLEILDGSSRELEQMILTLLTYAQWRLEREQGEFEWFDVAQLVREIEQARKLPLSRGSLTLEVRIRSPRLYGQRQRIREVLGNLVDNAIKHAPANSRIEIGVAVEGRECRLSVRDYGGGVPQDQRQKIFQPFVRGKEPQEAKFRGTGVGLSIVRETMLEYNGSVEVEDANPGARFVLNWPAFYQ